MVQIALVGLNAVGTSLGLVLRGDPRWAGITGYDPLLMVQRSARGRGAFERGAGSVEEAVRGADVVIFSGSPAEVEERLDEAAVHLKPGAVVTATTAASGALAKAAAQLPGGVSFVSGYPVVRPAGEGPEHASADLFRERLWCVTPLAGASPEAISVVSAMIESAGGQLYFADPTEHDSWMAGVRVLPRLLASALLLAVAGGEEWRESQRLAGRFFDDSVRSAGSDPAEAASEAVSLSDRLDPWIDQLVSRLTELRDMAKAGDRGALEERIAEAQRLHATWMAAAERGFPSDDAVRVSDALDSARRRGFFRRGR